MDDRFQILECRFEAVMQLSIIIVNYNVKYLLEQCLCSVLKAAAGIDTEIFVVDNASTDGSREYLEPIFPGVQFIWNNENPGFAKANNAALKKATGEYVLFLNPDTLVAEDCFLKCIRFMQNHSDAGALGVHMINGNGAFLKESKRSFPSSSVAFYKLIGLSSLFPSSEIFARYHLGHLSEKENHEVEVLSGAFMMVRKQALDITGGFDEHFFMYGEDIDLSYRIQHSIHPSNGGNYKNYYFSQTTIVHYKGESTKKGSLNYVRLFYKAMNQFVKKHPQEFYSGMFTFFISVAIWCRALLSAVKRVVQYIIPVSKEKEKLPQRIIAAGTGDELKQLQAISPSQSFVAVIDVTGESNIVEKLSSVIHEAKPGELIVCAGGALSFATIISLFEQLGKQVSIRVYVSH
ncbi:MAG: glycosyltransferase family 2 protein [Chitinophagaceae bacterium]|nr:glycosyltransferase family 2 protein [Chitinophagaceae bacterium]